MATSISSPAVALLASFLVGCGSANDSTAPPATPASSPAPTAITAIYEQTGMNEYITPSFTTPPRPWKIVWSQACPAGSSLAIEVENPTTSIDFFDLDNSRGVR